MCMCNLCVCFLACMLACFSPLCVMFYLLTSSLFSLQATALVHSLRFHDSIASHLLNFAMEASESDERLHGLAVDALGKAAMVRTRAPPPPTTQAPPAHNPVRWNTGA